MPGEAAPLPRPINGVAGPLPPQGSNPMPNSQTPGHPSFRRQRSSRACETCHARKVTCTLERPRSVFESEVVNCDIRCCAQCGLNTSPFIRIID